eukprot:TRINITY_DN17462_c0_g1_i1.p1 TRINITY_DN17462_c0_g1~~TRINITY_DN17462_c0_g1_i1.p1  ORF type:complete len:268 (-),score=57.67 TRINITY_DN17462_c0_g1_i1:754-1497(-)
MPGLVTQPESSEQEQAQAPSEAGQHGGFSPEFLFGLVNEQERTFMQHVCQLSIGTRFQVLWRIEEVNDESNQTVSSRYRWWGCKLLGPAFVEGSQPSSGALLRDDQQRQVWKILYDAEEGFEQEIRTVAFTDQQGELYDVQENGNLEWRLEGDYSSDDEGSYEMADDELVDIGQLDSFSDYLVETMERAAMSQMQNLPADQQLRIASAMREFIDHVVEGVGEVTQQGNNVVTQQHIQDIMRRFRGPQ